MFQFGTIASWWPVARRHPVVRDKSKSVLKAVGYAAVIDHIERVNPQRVLEFGHSVTTPLFDLFGSSREMWGFDAVSGAYYNADDAMRAFRARHSGSRFIDGLFGTEADTALPDGTFDLVCSVSTIEHIPEGVLPRVFASIRRVLKPGGVFLSSYDVLWGQPVKPMFDAIEGAGLAWLTERSEMDVFWSRWLRSFTPEESLEITRRAAFEDGRRVLDGFMATMAEDQRRFLQALTIIVGAKRPL